MTAMLKIVSVEIEVAETNFEIRPFSLSLKQPKLLVLALRSPPIINILQLLEISRKSSKGIKIETENELRT
ncbi:hypothetical protein BpHYR1_022408 [Brachionus plicatilis]|uniref:Uncharacterized protein n=1 Tax=Brachionus plicatilis TaxID=10195 RepID=A0A3M7R314_BRAPC|nr:hypothetical protein BpHYR1_022408 [Brachionus plicatilis]